MGMQFHTIGTNGTWSNTLGVGNAYNESYSYDANGNIATLNRNGSSTQPAMDNLKYWYYYKNKDGTDKYYDAAPTALKPVDADKYTNKLAYVEDAINATNYNEDIDGQAAGNYLYDKIGNLTKDVDGKIDNITWTVYGKIKNIAKTDGSTLQYNYDAGGNRINKVYINGGTTTTTYYVRDAQGNMLGLYEGAERKEQYLFGSSRLGVWKPSIGGADPAREYELTNHLGNVMATISDKKTFNGGFNEADVVTMNDYYPGGMQMPGRKFSNGNIYRYGFNGKENDNEVKGEGNQQDYGMRIYDSRLGRFLSKDPLSKSYPWYTPYQFAGNTPIQAVDLDGGEPKSVVKQNVSYSTWTIAPEKDDPRQEYERVQVRIVTYKFTEAAIHLLSLVSGISSSDIEKVDIKNASGSLTPAPLGNYNPAVAGGALTMPGTSNNQYIINYTENFFDRGDGGVDYKKTRTDESNDVIGWLRLTTHEVGHIKDIKEIGGGTAKYFATFLAGYAKAGGHDDYWREKRADIGQDVFVNFNSFIDKYYGKDKLKALFENKNNTDKDIIGKLNTWWGRYQKEQEE